MTSSCKVAVVAILLFVSKKFQIADFLAAVRNSFKYCVESGDGDQKNSQKVEKFMRRVPRYATLKTLARGLAAFH